MKVSTSSISAILLVTLPAALSTSNPAHHPLLPAGHVNQTISLADFKKMLRTEVTEEFGGRRLSDAAASTMWETAMRAEWSVAEEREATASEGRRRTTSGAANGSSPFLVCDLNFRKPGDQCKETVEQAVGANLTPVINKSDMTCFMVKTLASIATDLPVGVTAVPLSPEMKMAEGLVKAIATSSPMVQRVDAAFCLGEAATDDQAVHLADELLEEFTEEFSGERRLRTRSFMESRTYRNHERQLFWHRNLLDVEESVCQEMIASSTVEASISGLTLTIPDGPLPESYRKCLHSLVVDLAMQPEICFVGGYQKMQLRNDYGSGLVQSGNITSKPFHDLGLDGSGQIVAVSDTGVDTDNCYFYDSQRPLEKDESGRFDLDARKIVQYYAFADSKDDKDGHGTHVASTIAGRRARNGREELDGKGDGIAKGAKLAVMDIGSCTFS